MKKIVIIGAGPAGLTTGLDLLTKSKNYDVTIIEKASEVGGLAKSVEHNGKVFDLGGHMFISDDSQVVKFWESILPIQGIPSRDDLILDRYCKISNGGPNPDDTDNVLLSRTNRNRIFTVKQFYDNPIMLTSDMVKTLGVTSSFKSELSKLGSNVFKRKEKTLEDYYVNRYGSHIYSLFLEKYLEKIWGIAPSKISASYGPVSDNELIEPSVCNEKNPELVGKVLSPHYYYPKLGVSQMWNIAADKFVELGGTLHKNCSVRKIHTEGDKVTGITCVMDDQEFNVPCDVLVSSMPVKELVSQLDNVPFNVKEVVHGLTYRSMVTIGVELADMGYKNDDFENPTINDFIPDSLLYIEEEKVKLGRIQVLNNFSPYINTDSEHVWLGLNYYCSDGDFYWNLGDKSWRDLVVNDLKRLNMIKCDKDILDYIKVSVSQALPFYNEFSDRMDEVIKFMDSYDNLFCVGRNGQHKFLSMDQSMLTGFETVKAIIKDSKDRSYVWDISKRKSEKKDTKLYNSALLSGEGEYTGNYIPLQKEIPDNGEKREVSIRRMRRPMMTPIKKAEPPVEEVPAGPIFSKESVVIAARPDQTIPFDEEEISAYENVNNQNSEPEIVDYHENAETYVDASVTENVVSEENVTIEKSIEIIEESVNEEIVEQQVVNDEEISVVEMQEELSSDSIEEDVVSEDVYAKAIEAEKEAIKEKSEGFIKSDDSLENASIFRSAASFREVEGVSELLRQVSRPEKTSDDTVSLRTTTSFRNIEEQDDNRNATRSDGLFIGMPVDNPEPLKPLDSIKTSNRVSKEVNFIVTDDINVVVEPVRPEVGGIVKSDSIFTTGDIFKTDNIVREERNDNRNSNKESGIIVSDYSPIVGAFNDKQLNNVSESDSKPETRRENLDNDNLKVVKMENEIPTFHIVKSEDVAESIHAVAPEANDNSAEESKVSSDEEIKEDANEAVKDVKENGHPAKTPEQIAFEKEIEEEIQKSRKGDMTLDRSIVRGRSTVQDFADKKATDIVDREDSGVIKGASTFDNVLAGKNTIITSDKPVAPKPAYQPKKVIDPSEIFKNAKVIKTTVISSGADNKSASVREEPKKDSLVDELTSKGKVIAVIKNGETIPVEDTSATKKQVKSTKKRNNKADDAEIVEAAPISVVIEPDPKAETAQALPTPKKRTRKPKINK